METPVDLVILARGDRHVWPHAPSISVFFEMTQAPKHPSTPKMPPTTPYSAALNHREPLGAMRDAIARIDTLTSGWNSAEFERAYAPGKWSA